MKYKGIELNNGRESKAELLVNIELIGNLDRNILRKRIEELANKLDYFAERNGICICAYEKDNYLSITCSDISFNKESVDIVTAFYNDVMNANFTDVNISINVRVDGIVPLNDFLANVEY